MVSAEEIARASESLPQRMKDDIAFAHAGDDRLAKYFPDEHFDLA